MHRRMITLGAATIAAAALTGGGIALATGGGGEPPLTGTARDQATAAALRHTGGGTVAETETGDDGAAYSVEVRRADGTQVEVNLDAEFDVIGSERDDDGAADEAEAGDD